MSIPPEDGMTTEQDALPESDPEIIEQPTKYGWKPPDEWKGDEPPNGFMKPDEFLARPAVQLKVTQDKFEEFRAMQEATQAELRETIIGRGELIPHLPSRILLLVQLP